MQIRLTHWGRVTHICVDKLTIIGSDNGLTPDRRQAIIWTNAGILLIGPLGTNFSEILIEILIFSLKKMRLKVSSAKRRPFCLGLNVLTEWSNNSRMTLQASIGLLLSTKRLTRVDENKIIRAWARTSQFNLCLKCLWLQQNEHKTSMSVSCLVPYGHFVMPGTLWVCCHA